MNDISLGVALSALFDLSNISEEVRGKVVIFPLG